MDNGNGQWTMDNRQWTMENGKWTMDNGQWTMKLENGKWKINNRQKDRHVKDRQKEIKKERQTESPYREYFVPNKNFDELILTWSKADKS